MGVAQSLARKGLIGEAVVKAKTENAKALYSATEGRAANYFPPASQLQKTFGLSNSNYSLFKDPLHPAPLTRGYVFRPNETLEAWWNRQELKASRFSTQLTKDLVNVLKNTDINDSNKLKELYKQADLWLIHKQGQSTSRYNQVEALRNNIYHRLQQPEFGITRRELAEINRTNLKDTDYFLNYWIQGSKAASYYSTPETKELEQAIFTHSGQEPTKESDLALLQKMDEWLGKKQTSSSKRYDLVNSMRVHLQRVIEETYAIKLENVDGVTHEVAQDDSSSQFIL